MNWILLAALFAPTQPQQMGLPLLKGVKRIVFLGDSITYSGQYIDYIEAVLVTRFPAQIVRCAGKSETRKMYES